MLKAVRSAICLVENHKNHPKTIPSLAKLFVAWISMDEEAKLNSLNKESRILNVVTREINELGCPASVGEVTEWVKNELAKLNDPFKRTLEACHEHIKLQLNTLQKTDKNCEANATKALNINPIHTLRVFEVEKCHRTLLKTANFKDNTFKAKAKELFPHSVYFKSV